MHSELQKMILAEHSRAQMERIVRWVGMDDKKLKMLIELFMSEEKVISQRAGYPLSAIGEYYPQRLSPYLAKLIYYARTPNKHDAVYRSIARILDYALIPSRLHGKAMELCFDWLMDTHQKVAVKAFALSVLGDLLDLYPEIGSELKIIIEDQIIHQTPAFKSRAKKILKKLA
ncbi:MAG: hypothetical protein IPK94_20285 [Saprospiraceae bacterium]|jgi:hypothetical protein|nr:hypothetical protein [Saprospiraceae bacterium]MBK6815357.1 hypothetical protein [Saprospiraceae bacterium]MBK7372397.1 hypothetical protein [Saprospiraceae bacterium]MBK7439026.1 hypothetical protein [Saprospiraceae bacterium]MBK8282408.1 hypothetical protein [Saprospiraceae bacterium]